MYGDELKWIIVAPLTRAEKGFIERVKHVHRKFLAMCETESIEPGAGSYVLSEKGNVFHGVPFDVARCIHGEENAIGTMVTEEGFNAKLKIILIIGSPKDIIMPCGMCREAINRYGVRNATVLCANLSLTRIEKFHIPDLYPRPYDYALWE